MRVRVIRAWREASYGDGSEIFLVQSMDDGETRWRFREQFKRLENALSYAHYLFSPEVIMELS